MNITEKAREQVQRLAEELDKCQCDAHASAFIFCALARIATRNSRKGPSIWSPPLKEPRGSLAVCGKRMAGVGRLENAGYSVAITR